MCQGGEMELFYKSVHGSKMVDKTEVNVYKFALHFEEVLSHIIALIPLFFSQSSFNLVIERRWAGEQLLRAVKDLSQKQMSNLE